ncbi:MAG: hypothetical protein PVH88_19590 [Ignavibacteria bacterium]|jgi:hypothetical protein
MKRVLLPIAFSVIILCGCSSESIISNWNNNQIEVDGNYEEWGKNIKYFEDGKIAFGAVNDAQYLYLCVLSRDQSTIMNMMTGLNIWLNPVDGGNKIGIKYPVKGERGEADFNPQMRDRSQGSQNQERKNPSEMLKERLAEQDEAFIVNEKGLSLSSIKLYEIGDGFLIRSNYEDYQFVYELRIPLETTDAYPVLTANAGERVEINIETDDMSKSGSDNGPPSSPGGSGSRMPPGGPGGGMGGGRGLGGGMGGPGGNMTEQLELELTVVLAAEN